MNDFDRYLGVELKLLLDPVVARTPPIRNQRSVIARLPQPPAVEMSASEPIPGPEPLVVVTLPVASARSL